MPGAGGGGAEEIRARLGCAALMHRPGAPAPRAIHGARRRER